MKKIIATALTTLVVSSLAILPTFAAEESANDQNTALATENAMISASDTTGAASNSVLMVNGKDGSVSQVSFDEDADAEPAATENVTINPSDITGSADDSVLMVNGKDGSVSQVPFTDVAE